MDVAVHTHPDALADLAPAWDALWAADRHATPFQSPAYARAWEHVFGAGHDVSVVEVREGSDLTGLVTLTIGPDAVLRFLGDAEVTDYLQPLAHADMEEAVADASIHAIAGLDGWRVASLEGLATDTVWPDALTRAAKAAGLTVEQVPLDVCPRVEIPGTFDDYLASLEPKLRHEIRRKGRKLERDAGAYTVRVSTPETIDADLEHFYEMHRASDGHKGKFMHWGMEGMFKLIAREFVTKGWLRFVWLEIDGVALAAVFGFAWRGTWSVYNSAFDHTKRDLGPGMVVMAETLKLAAAEGCATFDFLRGQEPYKYRFGATDVPLVALAMTKP